MPQSEARAWWDDVQHLRKDAPAGSAPSASATALRLADDLPLAPEPTRARDRPAARRVLLVTDEEPAAPTRRSDRRASARTTAGDARSARALAPAPAPRAVELLEGSSPLPAPAIDPRRLALAPEPVVGDDAADGSRATLARRERSDRPARAERGAALSARLLASPDRLALYAVVLGILLVMIAAGSGHSS